MLHHDNSPSSVIPFLVQSNELGLTSYHNPCFNLKSSENCGVGDVTPNSLVEVSLSEVAASLDPATDEAHSKLTFIPGHTASHHGGHS